jgi:hypothetical protein
VCGKTVVHQLVFMMHIYIYMHCHVDGHARCNDGVYTCVRRQSVYNHTCTAKDQEEVKSVLTLDLLCINSTCGPGHFSIQIAAQS